MKLKALVITMLFAAGVATSVAVAKGPPPGKGKGKDDGAAVSTSGSTSTGTTTTTSGAGKGKKSDKKNEKGEKKKEQTKGAASACKPTVTFVLKGEFVAGGDSATDGNSAGGASTGSTAKGPVVLGTFEMEVVQANKHGQAYVGKTATVSYDKKTKFRRRGHAEIDDFEAGDRLNVHVRGCKKSKADDQNDGEDSDSGSTTTGSDSADAGQELLLAKQVVGQPTKGSDSDGTTTTTTTTTSP